MLETFASQAVIAIENVRLFKELQERNRELTEALDQQTATSEVLDMIAHSPVDLQPVYQAILANTTRLCEANIAALSYTTAKSSALLRATERHRSSRNISSIAALPRAVIRRLDWLL
jgi:uncharacterized protein (DUF1778 family)